MTLTEIFAVGNFVFLLLTMVGGYIVLRSTISKSATEVQTRVRDALTAENALLQSQVKRVVENSQRLERLLLMLQEAMRRRGIEIEVDDETVIIRDDKETRISKLPPPL
jgi:division protein CdvB (Snf7/Vps24/ESCRT-III family)